MSVLVLVPVLNRPHRVTALSASLHGAAPILWLASPGDDDEIGAIRNEMFMSNDTLDIVGWEPGPGDYAKKINHGYQRAVGFATGYDWIFQGADDLRFHDGWLDAALTVAQETGARVVGTNDLWNPAVKKGRHSTHTLIATNYIAEHGGGWDGPGVVLHEGYDHQCVDNELCYVAQLRGEWAFAKESIVEHLHPFAHKAEKDSTYEKALAHGRQDIALFTRRKNEHTRRRGGPGR